MTVQVADDPRFAKLFLGAISLELKSQKDPALRDLPKKLVSSYMPDKEDEELNN